MLLFSIETEEVIWCHLVRNCLTPKDRCGGCAKNFRPGKQANHPGRSICRRYFCGCTKNPRPLWALESPANCGNHRGLCRNIPSIHLTSVCRRWKKWRIEVYIQNETICTQFYKFVSRRLLTRRKNHLLFGKDVQVHELYMTDLA